MKEWLKAHWKVIAAVGAGAVGLYLLWQRSQGAAAPAGPAADTSSSLPPTGGPPGSYFSGGEQAAAGYAQQLASQAQTSQQAYGAIEQTTTGPVPTSDLPLLNLLPGATATGVVSEGWKQVLYNGEQAWEDISGEGRNAITEQQAESPTLVQHGYGPHAVGKPNTLNAIERVANFVTAVVSGGSAGGGVSGSVVGNLQGSGVNMSPVPTPQEIASIQGLPGHVAGPTTPAAIPNHAVGVK